MSDIEAILTRHGRKFRCAAGAVRGAASRTGDLLPAVAQVAADPHPDLDLSDRLAQLLTRLEVGVPAAAVEIARFAGPRLCGNYHQMIKAGLGTAQAVERADDAQLAACLGGSDAVQRSARRPGSSASRQRERRPAEFPA